MRRKERTESSRTAIQTLYGVHERPAVEQIEAGIVMGGIGGLGKHEGIAFLRTDSGDSALPERERYTLRVITTETVYIRFVHPIEHASLHRVADYGQGIIEEGYIRPLLLIRRLRRLVPIRMHCCPRVIPRGVVGNPIEHDAHIVLVRRTDQVLEVIHRTESRVDSRVILYTIGRADRLAVRSNRMDRHQP